MDCQLAVIGGGAMGEAIIAGAVKSGLYSSETIGVGEPLSARRDYLKEKYRVHVTEDNLSLVSRASMVVMAVKPQFFFQVLHSFVGKMSPGQLLISVAAGISLGEMEKIVPAGLALARVAPNTPCLVGKGAAAIAYGSAVTEEHRKKVRELFQSLGLAVEVPEKYLNAITGLSGSGPAYVYLFLEALIEAGVRVGLPRDLSRQLVLQTVFGAVTMAQETGRHPAELKEMVTSPGGTTAAALEVLESGAFRGLVLGAVVKAFQRAEELSGNQ
ncbi:MAG: pyrroline-5-carboxylate reductase [Clostridia bacterium]|nr:pyrroline-5-carboxylate reductase [Clostridia bacterium]